MLCCGILANSAREASVVNDMNDDVRVEVPVVQVDVEGHPAFFMADEQSLDGAGERAD